MIGYGDNSEQTWTAAMVVRYPHITCATMAMAYDNGCVNAEQSEEEVVEKLVAWLRQPEQVLRYTGAVPWLDEMERMLSTLSFEEMTDLTCGEETEARGFMRAHGIIALEELLMCIFDEVLG